MKASWLLPIIAAVTTALLPPVNSCLAINGITRLVMITQMKLDKVNQESLEVIKNQKKSLEQQKRIREIRALQAKLDALTKGGLSDPAAAEKEIYRIDRQIDSIRREVRVSSALVTPAPTRPPRFLEKK